MSESENSTATHARAIRERQEAAAKERQRRLDEALDEPLKKSGAGRALLRERDQLDAEYQSKIVPLLDRYSELRKSLPPPGSCDAQELDNTWTIIQDYNQRRSDWQNLYNSFPRSTAPTPASADNPAAKPIDTTGWLTIADANMKTAINKGTISRACGDGTDDTILATGNGRKRLIEPASLDRWAAQRKSSPSDRARLSPQPRSAISSGECTSCGTTVTLRGGAGICPKCNSSSIDPLLPKRNVAQR